MTPNADDDDGDGVLDWAQGVTPDGSLRHGRRSLADNDLYGMSIVGLDAHLPFPPERIVSKRWSIGRHPIPPTCNHVTNSYRVWYRVIPGDPGSHPVLASEDQIGTPPQRLLRGSSEEYIDITGRIFEGDLPTDGLVLFEFRPGFHLRARPNHPDEYLHVRDILSGIGVHTAIRYTQDSEEYCNGSVEMVYHGAKTIPLHVVDLEILPASGTRAGDALNPLMLSRGRDEDLAFETSYPQDIIAGAVADGSSPCLVGLNGMPDSMRSRVTVSVRRQDRPNVTSAQVVGSLHPPDAHLQWPGIRTVLRELPVRSYDVDPTSSTLSFAPLDFRWAVYYPPDQYLSERENPQAPGGQVLSNAEQTPLSFVVSLDGREIANRTFWLRRPPVVLIHGINSGPATWTASRWSMDPQGDGSNPDFSPTTVLHADWSATGLLGYTENVVVLSRTIINAQKLYQRGHPGLFRWSPQPNLELVPQASHVRYAMNQVDVVAHSQGGQITRLYASEIQSLGATPRSNATVPASAGWPPLELARTTQAAWDQGLFPYRHSGNFNLGTIRRFVPIGSPFNGSPIADRLERWLRPHNNDVGLSMLRALPEGQLKSLLFVNNVYQAPTCVVDLRTDSVIEGLLAGNQYAPAGPTWRPIATLAQDNFNVDWGTVQLLLEESALMGAVRPLESIDWAQDGDLIVTRASQRNLGRAISGPDPRSTAGQDLAGIAHMNIGPLVGQTSSGEVSDSVWKSLNRPALTVVGSPDFWLGSVYLGGSP